MLAQNTVSPVLSELRSGTAESHKAIESVMPFFREDFDLEQYRQILTKFYGFHGSFEDMISHQLTDKKTALIYDERRKLAALKKDLSFFHSEEEIAALPVCDSLPDYSMTAALFGGLYVIEGSSLGGQVITAHLQKMGVPSEARNYFSGYGANTGKMWKQFQAELNAQVQTPYEISECVRAARDTFTSLHQWMAQ